MDKDIPKYENPPLRNSIIPWIAVIVFLSAVGAVTEYWKYIVPLFVDFWKTSTAMTWIAIVALLTLFSISSGISSLCTEIRCLQTEVERLREEMNDLIYPISEEWKNRET